jgi:hypothetical protein
MHMNDKNVASSGGHGCPDKCAGSTAREREVTGIELNHISHKARREIATSHGHALICAYCGCVYIREGGFTRRLGMLIAGWHSELFPN